MGTPNIAIQGILDPPTLDADTSMPADHANTLPIDIVTIPALADSSDHLPSGSSTPMDTTDVDGFTDEDAPRADSEAPSIPQIEIEPPPSDTEAPSVIVTVSPSSMSLTTIDVEKVPTFLRDHGKGNRRVDIFKYLNQVQDPHFQRVLFHYINFEVNDESGVGGTLRLPTANRPFEISQWSSRARPSTLPDFTTGKRTVAMFIDSILAWWGSLQPSWRSFQRDRVSREILGDWDVLYAPRINGLLNVVILVFWWSQLLEEHKSEGGARADYEFFADDVAWVISCLYT